jgi:predicted lipoprotein with Yx(FWY)xxD motif
MRIPPLLIVGALSALTLSACGSSHSSTTATDGAAPAAASAGLHVADSSLGKIVVDGHGMTVYMLSADSKNHATCDAGCQHFWPPTSSTKDAGIAVDVGSTALPGGGTTETVGGTPVYTFRLDQKPGDVNGEGVNEFGGVFYVVSPSGTPIMGASSSPSSSPSMPPAHGGGRY